MAVAAAAAALGKGTARQAVAAAALGEGTDPAAAGLGEAP